MISMTAIGAIHFHLLPRFQEPCGKLSPCPPAQVDRDREGDVQPDDADRDDREERDRDGRPVDVHLEQRGRRDDQRDDRGQDDRR